jgi:hypothetical protein
MYQSSFNIREKRGGTQKGGRGYKKKDLAQMPTIKKEIPIRTKMGEKICTRET